MFKDQYGLPIQSDGDPLDQLNRVGILALSDANWYKKLSWLYVYPSQYVRHVGGNPNNVSGDQLVPVFAAQMISDHQEARTRFGQLTTAMIKRFGFAQNTHDTTPGKTKFLPDFLLHRVLPFIARVYTPKLSLLADTVLFLNTLVTVIDLRIRNNPDHVDPFVNAVATLYAVNVYRPTYLSKLSARMLSKAHKGMRSEVIVDGILYVIHSVPDSLRHYHRNVSGGNPEVGECQVSHWIETLKIARG